MTDLILIIVSVLFLARGALRGFMSSLIGPFSIIAAGIASFLYYKSTQNVTISLSIGLIGPLVLGWCLKVLFKKPPLSILKVQEVSLLSRVGGALLTLMWGWVFIFFTLVLLAVLPDFSPAMTTVRDDVTQSITYTMIVVPLEKSFFGTQMHQPHVTVANMGASSNEAQALAQDPRFQQVLQDPQVQQAIQNHDYSKLMSNPKMLALVQQLMSDPANLQKVLGLYKNQSQPQ
jgi:uncharacterized membrane protein required for colicin V production